MKEAHMQLTRMEPQQVVGILKATGSSDPDVLMAAKEAQIGQLKMAKIGGTIFMFIFGFISLVMLITIIGIPVAIPTGLFATGGWWVQRNAKRNIQTIETTFQQYVAGLKGGSAPRGVVSMSPSASPSASGTASSSA
jgi:hypothetical protein